MGLHVNGFMFLKLIFKYEIFLLLDAGPDMTILGISTLSDVIKSQEKKKELSETLYKRLNFNFWLIRIETSVIFRTIAHQ